MVNQGRLNIDSYHQNTGDVALYHGHYYSVRSPGQSLAAIPVVAAMEGVLALAGGPGIGSKIGQHHARAPYFYFVVLLYVVTILTTVMPSVALLLCFFWFLRLISPSLRNRTLLTLALGLGTGIFAYARVFYSHVPAAALLFGAFVLICVAIPSALPLAEEGWPRRRPALAVSLAGLLMGFAFLFEYQTLAIILLLFAYLLLRCRRLLPWTFLGILPGGIASAGWNQLIYGNPSFTAFAPYTINFRANNTGLVGFHFPPSWQALWGLSFSPYRGLFFLSPFLLLAALGWGSLWHGHREIAPLVITIPLSYFFFLAMYVYWQEGSSVGPRYMIPALPFLALPVVLTLDKIRHKAVWLVILLLMLASVANTWIQSMSAPGYPADIEFNPLFSYSIPTMLHGDISAHLGLLLLAPFIGIRRGESMVVLPALLALWSGYALLLRKRPRHRGSRAAVGA